jgi:hypothetical protein
MTSLEKCRRTRVCLTACLIVLSAITFGCTSGTSTQTPTTAPDDKPYQFESEGQVPPPDPGSIRRDVDRVDVFEETPVSESEVPVESVEAIQEPPRTEEAIGDSIATGPGYRVQVFATGSLEAAKSFEAEVETRLGVAAYLQRIDGMYKVRVGDCRSRQQAEELLQRCRTGGYRDAWIVSSEVMWKRPKP